MCKGCLHFELLLGMPTCSYLVLNQGVFFLPYWYPPPWTPHRTNCIESNPMDCPQGSPKRPLPTVKVADTSTSAAGCATPVQITRICLRQSESTCF